MKKKVDYYLTAKNSNGQPEMRGGSIARLAIHASLLKRIDQIVDRDEVQFVDVHLTNGERFTASKMREVVKK